MKDKILVYPMEYQSIKDVIRIKPIYDLHKGSRSCDLKAFKEYIKDRDEKTRFFTGGDLWDAIYFNDKRFRISGQVAGESDDPIDEEVDEMADILKPIKYQLIAIGDGNHEDTIRERCHTNMSKRLAEKLGVPYLGYSYWFRLYLYQKSEDRNGRGRTVDFFVQHGYGGGTRTEGGSVTKYSRHADRFLCDIYCTGHDHKKQYVRYPVLGVRGKNPVTLYAQPKMVCVCGSWKKVYGSGTNTTWEEKKGFPPGELGGITINIKPTSEGVKMTCDM